MATIPNRGPETPLSKWTPHSTSSEILRVLRRISVTIVWPKMAGEPDLRLRLKAVPSSFGNDKKAVPTDASSHGSWGAAAPILLPPSYFRISIKGLFSLLS